MIKPPRPFHLRPLTIGDIADVLAIERLSLPTPRTKATYKYELTHNQLARYQALVRTETTQAEILLGYSGFWNIADEIHISMIAIDPVWRRQGLGELLLLNLLFLALEEQAQLVTLEVRRSNLAAQHLYKKYQFVEVGLRRHYYRDTGEDAKLMTVQLEGNDVYRSFLTQKQEVLFKRLQHAPS